MNSTISQECFEAKEGTNLWEGLGFLAHIIPDAPLNAIRRMSNDCRARTMSFNTYAAGSAWPAFEFLSGAMDVAPKLPPPDIIHAHDWCTFLAGVALKARFDCQLVMHVHSTDFERSGARSGDIEALEKICLPLADRVITVSRTTRKTICGQYEMREEDISVAHNGIALVSPYRPYARVTNTPIVTFAGRVTAQKNPLKFVRACKLVADARPEVSFVLAGTGDQLSEVRILLRALEIEDRVELPGFLRADELADLLSRSAMYVMPSKSEPFGIGALEALASCVPLIVSESAGIVEVVNGAHKINGNDPQSIAAAIIRLLDDAPYWAHLVRSGWDDCKSLSWEASAKVIAREYRCLCP